MKALQKTSALASPKTVMEQSGFTGTDLRLLLRARERRRGEGGRRIPRAEGLVLQAFGELLQRGEGRPRACTFPERRVSLVGNCSARQPGEELDGEDPGGARAAARASGGKRRYLTFGRAQWTRAFPSLTHSHTRLCGSLPCNPPGPSTLRLRARDSRLGKLGGRCCPHEA